MVNIGKGHANSNYIKWEFRHQKLVDEVTMRGSRKLDNTRLNLNVLNKIQRRGPVNHRLLHEARAIKYGVIEKLYLAYQKRFHVIMRPRP